MYAVYLFLLSMYVWGPVVCLCTHGAHRGPTRASDSLELESPVVVNLHAGAGDQT